jgi:EmrB/QacA subfamily drug resistance transporter
MTEAIKRRVNGSSPRGLALALLATTQFVLILDIAIVTVALPSIGTDLDFAPADLSWVINAYALMFGGFLLLGGRMADLIGRRRMFMVGLIVFVAASLAGALAQSALWLVIARGVQGLGAALVSPAALSLVMTLFPEGPERNKALGVWGAVAGSGGAAGAILGGVLTDVLSWQSVLYVNIPVGIAAVALAPRLLPEGRDVAGIRSFDLAGAVSVTAGLALLIYAVVDAENAGWTSVQTLVLGATSLALIASFVAIESRAKRPLLPLSTFRNRMLRSANIGAVLTTMALFPMWFLLTLYTQQVLGYSPLESGLAQLPIAVLIVVAAGPAQQLVTRMGPRIPLAAGLVMVAAGLAWFSQVSAGGSFLADILGPSILAGVGAALSFIAGTIAATSGTSEGDSGLASGLLNTSQQVGGSIGIAAIAAIATTRTENVIAAGERVQAVALTEGFQTGYVVAAAVALVAALVVTVLLPRRSEQPVIETEQPATEQVREAEVRPAQVAARRSASGAGPPSPGGSAPKPRRGHRPPASRFAGADPGRGGPSPWARAPRRRVGCGPSRPARLHRRRAAGGGGAR